jgi:hypothetical protein
MYCGGSCKQEAHRHRHGLIVPAFLKPDAVKKEKLRPTVRAKTNPVYQEKADVIGKLERRIEGLRHHKQANKQEEARILSQDDELLSKLSTAALSMVAVLGVAMIGFLVSKGLKGKDKANKTMFIAVVIGLGAAAFLALTTHGSTQQKNKLRKIERIRRLKEKSDQLEIEIVSAESELAVYQMELRALPATISELGSESYHEVQMKPPGGVMTATQLRSMTFDLLTVNDGYARLFGRPERGFAMAVYGAPAQGKSTFAARLAYDLAVDNGNGIYISAEEGFSQSLQNKGNTFETDHLLFSDHRTLASVKTELRRTHYDIVVLDSIQQMSISPDELISLREANLRTSFIYILQATKSGTFKGDNRYSHDADIQIKLDGYVPEVKKTRFLQVA